MTTPANASEVEEPRQGAVGSVARPEGLEPPTF
ncbi:hypothetical protein BH24ACT7_BH24ACT7_05380 [soil metagenome]